MHRWDQACTSMYKHIGAYLAGANGPSHLYRAVPARVFSFRMHSFKRRCLKLATTTRTSWTRRPWHLSSPNPDGRQHRQGTFAETLRQKVTMWSKGNLYDCSRTSEKHGSLSCGVTCGPGLDDISILSGTGLGASSAGARLLPRGVRSRPSRAEYSPRRRTTLSSQLIATGYESRNCSHKPYTYTNETNAWKHLWGQSI